MKLDWTSIAFGIILFIIGWLALPSPFYNTTKTIVIHDSIKVEIPIPEIKDSATAKIPLRMNKKMPFEVRRGEAVIAGSATLSGDSLDLSFAWKIQPKPIEFKRDTIIVMQPTTCPPRIFLLEPEFAYPTGIAIGLVIAYILLPKN